MANIVTLQAIVSAINSLPWVNNDRRLTGSVIQNLLLQLVAYVSSLSVANAVIYGRKTVADLDGYEMAATDYTLAFVKLSGQRTVFLPPAANVAPEQPYCVVDETGNCSAAAPIVISVSGTDTVAGTGAVTLSTPFQRVTLRSNGSNLWTF